jgi:hypothetical protein
MSKTLKDNMDTQLMDMLKLTQYCNEKRLDIIDRQLVLADKNIDTVNRTCREMISELANIKKGLTVITETQSLILARIDQFECEVNKKIKNSSRNRNKNKNNKHMDTYNSEPVIMDIQYDESESGVNTFESLLGNLLFPNQKKQDPKDKDPNKNSKKKKCR